MRDLLPPLLLLVFLKLWLDRVLFSAIANNQDESFLPGRSLRQTPKYKKNDDKIHVVILSNRLVATAVAMGSVCHTSKKKLHFHVFSTDDQEFHKYYNKLDVCQGSILELQSIDQATDSLLQLGFEPIWWQVEQQKKMDMEKNVSAQESQATELKKKEWGVQTPYTSDKHAHALNLLRFYLPYLPSLSGVDKFIFLDDDVVLKRGIEEIFSIDFKEGIAMIAGCQHWMWNGNIKGNFETKWNVTVLESAYIGNHAEVCDEEKEQPYGCLRAGLAEEISTVSQLLDPNSKFAANPLDRQAFNMGLNVYDNKEWKRLGLSHRFEQWVEASNNLRLFPLDTLSFGLCLAYLALGDTVQCYEPGPITHLVGMAFVTEVSYEVAGWPLQRINQDAYALHYNGAHKPWEKVNETNHCSIDMPTSLLDMWKKTCEDVGICECKATSTT